MVKKESEAFHSHNLSTELAGSLPKKMDVSKLKYGRA